MVVSKTELLARATGKHDKRAISGTKSDSKDPLT